MTTYLTLIGMLLLVVFPLLIPVAVTAILFSLQQIRSYRQPG
jgi:hypothetical protein